MDPESEESATIENCDQFTEAYCDAFAAANGCCPECADATSAYANCALKRHVSTFCPDASCDTTVPSTKSGANTQTIESKEQASFATTESLKATSSSYRKVAVGALGIAAGLLSLLL